MERWQEVWVDWYPWVCRVSKGECWKISREVGFCSGSWPMYYIHQGHWLEELGFKAWFERAVRPKRFDVCTMCVKIENARYYNPIWYHWRNFLNNSQLSMGITISSTSNYFAAFLVSHFEVMLVSVKMLIHKLKLIAKIGIFSPECQTPNFF